MHKTLLILILWFHMNAENKTTFSLVYESNMLIKALLFLFLVGLCFLRIWQVPFDKGSYDLATRISAAFVTLLIPYGVCYLLFRTTIFNDASIYHRTSFGTKSILSYSDIEHYSIDYSGEEIGRAHV